MEILTWAEFATKDDHGDQLEAGAGVLILLIELWLGGWAGRGWDTRCTFISFCHGHNAHSLSNDKIKCLKKETH